MTRIGNPASPESSEVIADAIDRVFDRLEPGGERPQPDLKPIDIVPGREVEGSDRLALGHGGPLAGTESSSQGAADEGVFGNRLCELGEGLLATCLDAAVGLVGQACSTLREPSFKAARSRADGIEDVASYKHNIFRVQPAIGFA